MADTKRTLAALQALLADNTSGDISAQDIRDFLVSSYRVVQVVNTKTGAVATGTTTIPMDDTIPQNTEGDEYMTLAITPFATDNLLRIDVVLNGGLSSTVMWLIVALFQDAVASALNATAYFVETANGARPVMLSHFMVAGTTSATTFKVRAGGSAATTLTVNGVSGARFFGGVMISSITITEYLP